MKSLTITGLFVILLASQAASQELTSTLHSTLYGVQIAYVDEMIVFTCVVRGSDNMAWTSEEYIGTGGQQLPFAAAEPVGSERRAIGNDQTVAMLVTAVNTGDIMIVSELRIRIKSTYPLASVQCISRGADITTMSSISFQLAAATSVTCDRQFLCPGETMVTCVCATANSSALAWTFNGTRLDFTSNNATLSRRGIPGLNGFVVLTENSITNGVRVIMSNITVSASSNDVTLTCGNVDQSMIEPITVPTIENCPVSPSGATPTGSDNSGDCTGHIIAAVVVPVILVIIAIPFMIFFILMFQAKLIKQKTEEIRSLNQRIDELDARIQPLKKENEALKQTKALQGDTIHDLQAALKEKENQLTGKVDDLQQKLDEKSGDILKLKTEIRDKDAVIRTQTSKLEANTKTIQDMTDQLSQEKEKAAASEELKKKVISIKEGHAAALKDMEKNMKKELQKGALKELKETMIKAIEERMSRGTGVDPEKDKVKDSKRAFETLKDEMKKSIDTTSSDLEKKLEEEIKKILEGDTSSKRSSSLFGFFS